MKKDKLRLFPMFIMLVAGLPTSILTYYFQYDIKMTLLILLSVLLLFYILGLIFVGVVHKFDEVNQAKQESEETEGEEETLSVEKKDNDNVESGDRTSAEAE